MTCVHLFGEASEQERRARRAGVPTKGNNDEGKDRLNEVYGQALPCFQRPRANAFRGKRTHARAREREREKA